MRLWKITLVLATLALVAMGVWWIDLTLSRASERAQAVTFANQGNNAEAIPLLLNVLKHNPEDIEAIALLVNAMLVTKQPLAEMMPWLNRWCELGKADARPFLLRLKINAARNHDLEAYEDVQVILAFNHENSDARRFAPILLGKLRRFNEAKLACLDLLNNGFIADSADPLWYETMTRLADMHAEVGDYSQAAKVLDEIIAKKQGTDVTILARADVHFKMGEYQEALALLKKAAKSNIPSTRLQSLNKQALTLTKLGLLDDAQIVYDRIAILRECIPELEKATRGEGDWELQLKAANALLATGYPEDAARLLEEALARLGGNRDAFLLVADCYEKLGKKPQAEQFRKKAQKVK
jgi:tetratricopeptide (TPR) repeat protein